MVITLKGTVRCPSSMNRSTYSHVQPFMSMSTMSQTASATPYSCSDISRELCLNLIYPHTSLHVIFHERQDLGRLLIHSFQTSGTWLRNWSIAKYLMEGKVFYKHSSSIWWSRNHVFKSLCYQWEAGLSFHGQNPLFTLCYLNAYRHHLLV